MDLRQGQISPLPPAGGALGGFSPPRESRNTSTTSPQNATSRDLRYSKYSHSRTHILLLTPLCNSLFLQERMAMTLHIELLHSNPIIRIPLFEFPYSNSFIRYHSKTGGSNVMKHFIVRMFFVRMVSDTRITWGLNSLEHK